MRPHRKAQLCIAADAAVGIVEVLLTSSVRMSALSIDIRRSWSVSSCTVYVSSFRRRPLITVPSFMVISTGLLIGIIWLVGSVTERNSCCGLRAVPMSELNRMVGR